MHSRGSNCVECMQERGGKEGEVRIGRPMRQRKGRGEEEEGGKIKKMGGVERESESKPPY